MDEIERIVRQIGQQQGENIYYRSCYSLFKRLQDLVARSSDDLHRIHQSGLAGSPTYGFDPVYQTIQELRVSLYDIIDQACDAQSACEELCPVDPSFAAVDAFKSLGRLHGHM
ncbi:uncharacterized protein N7482_007980 [Penicillium canariense]|uniref:Uncharacterized protein n=1 Tax=Penicillium canariense TaxID=189055 RepID=A0A9W9I038_9EURO|nr:uncharacterized protein N7482_007980 [Penicillium canariense]KAJ5160976.1 hypothetical protein N7482_007980 [Penicillium canariense]